MDKPGTLVSFFGLVLFVAGWWIICFAFKENCFAAPVVKHQKQQTVADTGVYGLVRHPMYGGAVLLVIGMTLSLESYAAALPAGGAIGTSATRNPCEDAF